MHIFINYSYHVYYFYQGEMTNKLELEESSFLQKKTGDVSPPAA